MMRGYLSEHEFQEGFNTTPGYGSVECLSLTKELQESVIKRVRKERAGSLLSSCSTRIAAG